MRSSIFDACNWSPFFKPLAENSFLFLFGFYSDLQVMLGGYQEYWTTNLRLQVNSLNISCPALN